MSRKQSAVPPEGAHHDAFGVGLDEKIMFGDGSAIDSCPICAAGAGVFLVIQKQRETLETQPFTACLDSAFIKFVQIVDLGEFNRDFVECFQVIFEFSRSSSILAVRACSACLRLVMSRRAQTRLSISLFISRI